MNSLTTEPYDLDQVRGLSPIKMMFKMRHDLEFAMPAVGLSRQTTTIGGVKYQRLFYRCGVEGCWYVCIPRDESNLKEILTSHNNGLCPEPPRREALPSGLSEIEKLWREIDDVMDALMSHTSYRDMSGDELKAYAKGLAFSVVMKDKEFYPDIRSVAKEGAERWKMRNETIPYRKTPTRHVNNFQAMHPTSGWIPTENKRPTKATPTVRKPTTVKKPQLSPGVEASIKAALTSGILQPEEVASMYGVTVEAVNALSA